MPESFWLDNEVQAMIDATGGISTTIGATTANALVDRTDEEMLMAANMAAYVGKSVVVTIRTNAFPSLAQGQTVSIAGATKTYKVRQFMQVGDGATTRVLCAED